MKNIKLKNFGPIANVDVDFGDLTLLVGPQASGKSIFIQLLKLLLDKNNIKKTLEQYNYVWANDTNKILDLYFGEGLAGLWKSSTEIILDDRKIDKSFLVPKSGRDANSNSDETMFYIPAQRILSMSEGRTKNFMEFENSTPYVLRHFSEILRQQFQNGMEHSESIFPISNRLKEPLRKSFNESIFHNGKVIIDKKTGQKKLKMEVDGMSIPFISWSAGQKEFMPLLMGFYWLCPPSKESQKDAIKYVVIEEPEMGLHPEAIKSVILQVIDLLSREYKVIISTHSPVLLEFAWAFNYLKKSAVGYNGLFDLFDITKSTQTKKMFENIIEKKTINTFYFARRNQQVFSTNISILDAASENEDISAWGGLSQFSSKVTDIVSKYYDSND